MNQNQAINLLAINLPHWLGITAFYPEKKILILCS